MGLLIRLVELLIILVPVIGVIVAAMKGLGAVRGRGIQSAGDTDVDPGPDQSPANESGRWRAIRRTIEEHDRTDTRWLEYELDLVKLLNYPLMTDMREPVTQQFHRAKLRADLLRPIAAEALVNDRDGFAEYREAVEDYASAFHVAENEAIRTRRRHFSEAEQQRVSRAQSLLLVASDTTATPQERARAYSLARRELDGLMVLPERTLAQIERGISGELEGGEA
ncbi:hypothetical protein HGA11_30185 [Mycolicibacterium septicum DSM 44393]|uniref:Uncharacterized protein n=1 Tax=Mycolicibacterium septicum DSM 44393 TaxID=1341646 RepID=A0A7X6RZ42_9MYCO|nr:hypothetical protein [Mycolicibacterium septicum]NKZ15248.1 hypothetical protein [Mycolicibacterium septicum DSM 44393]